MRLCHRGISGLGMVGVVGLDDRRGGRATVITNFGSGGALVFGVSSWSGSYRGVVQPPPPLRSVTRIKGNNSNRNEVKAKIIEYIRINLVWCGVSVSGGREIDLSLMTFRRQLIFCLIHGRSKQKNERIKQNESKRIETNRNETKTNKTSFKTIQHKNKPNR